MADIQNKIDEALKKNSEGEPIYLSDMEDYKLSPTQKLEKERVNQAIIDAVYNYELSRGGLVIEDGLYRVTEICGSLPQQMCDEQNS